MPGARLTQEDRERVAAGLAEKAGYAEIARRLGRPTSTVSREVDRNGGPDGYRADRAHRAAARRASRRRHPLPGGPAPADGPDNEAVGEFAEHFAAVMVQTGLPRMAARVLASLITTDSGALTAAALVQRLRVSPASISGAVGYLAGLDLLRRERVARHERYVIDDDTWLRTWLTSARTNSMLAETAQRGATVLDPATPAGARLDYMADFFARLSDDMTGGAALFDDALTVLAALVHAGGPRTGRQLAEALGWAPDRVARALDDAAKHPDVGGPVVLRRAGPGGFAVVARPERLTDAQREALTVTGGASG